MINLKLQNPREGVEKASICGQTVFTIHILLQGWAKTVKEGPYKSIGAAKAVYTRMYQSPEFYDKPKWKEDERN